MQTGQTDKLWPNTKKLKLGNPAINCCLTFYFSKDPKCCIKLYLSHLDVVTLSLLENTKQSMGEPCCLDATNPKIKLG